MLHPVRTNTQSRFAKLIAAVGVLAGGFGAAHAASSTALVVNTQTAVSTVQSGPVAIVGVKGGVAVNKFGDLFVPSFNNESVIEFPANGAAPFAIFKLGSSYTGNHVGGVAVDANQNLYVTTVYVGAQTTTDSAIFEFPFVNGTYPSAYTYSGPVGQCSATPTTVCAWGNFLQATGYYYQPLAFAIDGTGVGYLVTSYDNHASSLGLANNGGITIYRCNASCESRTSNATILVDSLPNRITSITADAVGNVFYADGSPNIYEVVAGTQSTTVINNHFTKTLGVALDPAGNLFVSDNAGFYEIPKANGTYGVNAQFKISTLGGVDTAGSAIDPHGNIYLPQGYFNVFKLNVNGGTLASAAVASATSTSNLNVIFNSAVTGVTAVANNTEFALSGSTCAAGGAAGASCSITATFTPKAVGSRRGSVLLTDAAGDTTRVLLSGTASGAGMTLDPAKITSIAAGYKSTAGVAVDAAGNVFIADTTANAVYEYVNGAGTAISIGSGLISPTGVATDGGGSVYIADNGGTGSATGRVVMVPVVGGALSTAGQTSVVTGLGTPQGIAVDGMGTLYVADKTNKNVFVLSQSQFGQSGGSTFGTGLTAPSDVAIDNSGMLYIADPAANQVVRITQEGVQSVLGSGLSAPSSIAVDPSQSLIIADQGNKRIVRIPNEAGALNANDLTSISTGIVSPSALRLDGSGNLIAADSLAKTLSFLNRTATALTFTGVNVGTKSSPQILTLTSEGNAGLVLGSPLYTLAAGDFAIAQGTPPCTSGTTVAVAYSCQLSATFSPSSKLPQSVTVNLSSNAQNTTTPSVTLSGTGLQLATATASLVQTAPVGSPSYGSAVSFSATVAGSAAANNAVPTGTVALVVDGSLQPSAALLNGTASLTINGLSGGSHTISVIYSGDGNYAAANSANLIVNVTPVGSTTTLAITTTAISPLSAALNASITFSSTLTPSIPGALTGTVSYMSGTTVLATAPVLSGSGGIYTASTTVTNVPSGTYNVVAVYSGNAAYVSSSSAAQQLIVVDISTFTITPSTTTLTSSAGSASSSTLTITSLAGFQGAVDFSCAGLPAHATCVFTPALVTLFSTNPNTSPITVGTVTTSLSIVINQAPVVAGGSLYGWGAVMLFGLIAFRRKNKSWSHLCRAALGLSLLFASLTGLSGCGSSDNLTPAGTSTITVTGSASPSIPGTVTTAPFTLRTKSITLNLSVK